MTSVVESPSRPLSLHIDTPASASPFPSPSSSFLPPPVPDAHEFAVKLPPRKKTTPNVSMAESLSQGSADSPSAPSSVQGCETDKSLSQTVTATKPESAVAEPTTTQPSESASDSQLSKPTLSQTTSSDALMVQQDIDMLSPTTPTPASFHFSTVGSGTVKPPETPTQTDTQMQSQYTSYPLSSLAQSQSTRAPLSPILTNSPTLSPTRPAPLSPAASRRTSTISAQSSKSTASDPLSRSNSRRQSKRSSAGLGGIGLALTSGSGTGTGNRQSTLSALSTGSGNVLLAPQKEGDEDAGNDNAMDSAANVTTPTAATSPSNVASMMVTTPLSATMTNITDPTTTTTPIQSPAAKPRNRRRSTKVKIFVRDFAFKKSDDKYRGLGSDVPKPNRFARLNKKLGGSKKVRPSSRRWSTTSESTGVASSDGDESKEGKERRGRGLFRAKSPDDDEDEDNDDEDDDDDDDDDDNDGWFRRGMGRFSLSFGLSNLRKRIQQEEEERQRKEREAAASANIETYPSRDEMELNFVEDNHHSATPESGRSSSDVYYDAQDTGMADPTAVGGPEHQDEGEAGEEDEEELVPGQYRAIFAFEPEGTAEMRLIEDQIVQVVGRGGGVGWAIVVVPEGAEGGVEIAPGVRRALVPESYLEPVFDLE